MFARLKRRLFRHSLLVRRALFFVIIFAGICSVALLLLTFLRLGKAVLRPSSTLKNDHGRTNILLLGTGGPQHDGPDLTDTMMIISATRSGTINLISIPRDIYLDSLGDKVNSAYKLGLTQGPDVGLVLAKAVVSQVSGLPVHYAVRIDFSVFEKIIDLVGGVDVPVKNSFEDKEYPLAGKENDSCDGDPDFKCRYETIRFSAGIIHMDGQTGLKFVRSRHAPGDEGTDFARAARQQLVIKALKEKIFSSATYLNPAKILAIYNELKSHIDTDMNIQDNAQFTSLALNFRQAKIKTIVFDLNLLDNPPVDQRGWILVPKKGDWTDVHAFISNQLE